MLNRRFLLNLIVYMLVCYMLNPYLSRKRKTFEERVLSVFLKVGVNEKGLIGYAPDLNDEPNDAAE